MKFLAWNESDPHANAFESVARWRGDSCERGLKSAGNIFPARSSWIC